MVLHLKKQSQYFTMTSASSSLDDENSEIEDRFFLLGKSNQSRVLLICHCEKESGNLVRIISARKATAKERKLYKGEAL